MTLLPSTIHSAIRRTYGVPQRRANGAGRRATAARAGSPAARVKRSLSSVRAMTGLARAVRTVVRRCLAGARPRENVLVVVDEPLQDVGEALRREAQEAQADAVLAVMSPRENHGVEPPPPIAAAFAACDVFIAPDLALALAHAGAQARDRQRRARRDDAHASPPTCSRRLMDVDFDVLGARSRAVTDLLTDADEAHVTCPRGTDLRLDLARPPGHRRRRRPHRAGLVRQPAVRRGLHRAAERRGHGRHALAGLHRPRPGPPRAPDRSRAAA